jgi:O-acetylserine/cysteine efflux transporter
VTPRDNLRATLVAIIWGANFVVIDEGLKGFPPFLLLTARFSLVAFPLILFVPRPAPWRPILLVGLFMCLGQFSLLYLGLQLGMPAGLASLVVQVQVMFTILISRIWLGERSTPRQLTGVALGIGGLAVIALGYGSHAPIVPLLLTAAASLSWSIGNVVSRQAKVASGLGLVVWSAIVVPIPGLVLALIVNGSGEIGHALTHLSVLTVSSAIYTAVGSSLFGYVVWNSLLATYPVGSVVPFTLLVPVTGLATAWIVLGQRPTLTEVIGGLLLMAGVATATLQRGGARRAASSADPCPESEPPEQQPLDSQLSPSPASPA